MHKSYGIIVESIGAINCTYEPIADVNRIRYNHSIVTKHKQASVLMIFIKCCLYYVQFTTTVKVIKIKLCTIILSA
jgi:hypothetical protein